ncbi:hypothetical protein L6Q21_06185 [Sandaracinobacter sp. RS1-74]|uniref:tetratricopeptide repeat protein n=1 Tax=Sandaracinobacteroides sayramensis TaxID=2913411 RepID=UPI001EDA0717|nr:tetratricopeptide repeat protein [Sandaracinobacteroides sayramensis]MCG2840566.1 hypothetical protein [Sandaracinobacteroides sayramensis]
MGLALVLALSAGAAVLHAQPAPEVFPDGETLTLEFIDKALADGRLKSAADLLTRAQARGNSPELRLREAELLLASGLRNEADMLFRTLEAEPALAARAKTGRAVATLRDGQVEVAGELLKTAVALDPALARAWTTLAVLADQRQDWKAADAAYGKAIAAAPNDANAFNNRGYSRLLQQRTTEAEADFLKALELRPGLEIAETNLRLARGLQGRYTEAFAGSSRAQLGRDLNTVGYAAMLRGDLKLAESYFSRALELDPQYQSAAAANLAYLKQLAGGQSAHNP